MDCPKYLRSISLKLTEEQFQKLQKLFPSGSRSATLRALLDELISMREEEEDEVTITTTGNNSIFKGDGSD